MKIFYDAINGGGGHQVSLLLALILAVATLLFATLSAGAQTEDGDAPADTISGRVIVRVQDRTTDGGDDYRIEFGFLPEWAMEEKDPWTEAARTYADLLPRLRYFTKARVDQREEANDQRWLRSSDICVPSAAPSSPAANAGSSPPVDELDTDEDDDGCDGLAGRVIARYRPDSAGRLRIEFGFLPEWAFTSTESTQAAVEQHFGGELRPPSRYLTASLIANRRGAWLRSSLIPVPVDPPSEVEIEITSPLIEFKLLEEVPIRELAIGAIKGRLSDQSDAIAITGMLPGLTISTPAVRPNLKNLVLSGTVGRDAAVRSHEVTITARPPMGAPVTDTLTIRITPGDQVLTWDGYSPSTGRIGGNVELLNPLVVDGQGPRTPQWEYTLDKPDTDVCAVDPKTGELTLEAVGQCHVTATSVAREGFRMGTVRAIVTVTQKPIPEIHWLGYTAGEAIVGSPAPTLKPPVAEVGGRSVDVSYVYDLGEASKRDGICDVDSKGALTARAAGTCVVIVTSAETEAFAAAEPVARSVTIKAGTGLRWDGYDDRDLESFRVGRNAITPIVPQPRLIEARGNLTYTYSAVPASVCSVVPSTGALTPLAGGDCRVTVRGEPKEEFKDKFLADEVTVTVSILSGISIRCAPESPTVNQDVTCTVDLRGSTPTSYDWSGGASSGSNRTYTTSFNSHGKKTVLLTVRYGDGSSPSSASTVVSVNGPPVCDAIRDVGPLNSGQSARSINLDNYCRDPENEQLRYVATSSDNDIATFRLSGDLLTVTAATRDSGGTATITVTATDPAGLRGQTSFRVMVRAGGSITCTPSSPNVDQSVTCTAELGGGTPTSYAWSGGASSGSSRTYTTSFSSHGRKTISLEVAYGDGDGDNASTVVMVNGQPVCDTVRDIGWLNSGQSAPSIPLGSHCVDPENEPLRYAATSSNSNIATVDISGDSLTVTAARDSGGRATITVTATDPGGLRGQTSFRVTVNEPPVCQPVADITVSENANESVTIRCSDPDGDSITLSAESDDASIATASMSGSQVAVEGEETGTATITVIASDGNGGADSTSFDVRVTSENQPPECRSIGSISPIILNERSSVRFRCSDPDGSPRLIKVTVATDDSSIVRVAVSSNPSTLRIIDNLRSTLLSMEGVSRGTTTIRATATDANGGSTTILFNATVDDNRLPQCDSISDIAIEIGEREVVSARCSDPNGFTMSSLEAASNDESVATVVAGAQSYPEGALTRPLTITAVSTGVATITTTGTDAHGGSTSVTFQVTVEIEINSISCLPSSPRVSQSVTCSANLNGGTPDTYSWSGGSSSSKRSTYMTSFSTPGSKTVSLTVSNSGGNDSESIDIQVRPEGQSPECTGAHRDAAVDPERLGGTSFTISTFGGVHVTVDCTDPDGQDENLTFTHSSADTRIASINSSEDNIYLVQGVSGAHDDSTTVTVIATDSDGLTGSVSFTITVISSGPTMHGISPINLAVGENNDVTQLSWDPDGDRFTITAVSDDSNIASISVGNTEFGTMRPPGHSDLFGGRTILTITGKSVGTTTIRVSATDTNGARNSGIEFSVTVNTPEISKPEINNITCTPPSPTVNQSVTCTASLSGGTPDSYEWMGGRQIGREATYLTNFPSPPGTRTVRLTVNNSVGSDSNAINMTVQPPPPPSCDSISNVDVARRGVTQNVPVSCTDYRSLDVRSDNARIATVSVSGSQITVTGQRRGSATITVTVEGAGGTTRVEFDASVGNSPPTCSFPSTMTIYDDESFQVDGSCTDPDGGFPSLAANSNANNVATVSSASATSLWLRTDDPGSAIISYTASDGHGGTFRGSISVTVRDCVSRYVFSGKCSRYAD